ncbi:hypothetical protein LTR66_017204 [Elasticomyces elasticus]|nr:hypothetical protein LTR66_017204 [Elasticomyces elasticus]
MQGKDAKGEPLGREELTAEALTQLIAGSDTTSNTSCAILYYVLRTPNVLSEVQTELDEAFPIGTVPSYDSVKDLPYLTAILGYTFPPGTSLSVPAYTIHHSKEIWGANAEDFVPARMLEANLTARQKEAFIPFSYGPRACVGRNVAEMELKCIVGTVFRNFEFRDEDPNEILVTREGFLRKPLGFLVGVKRRDH